VRSEFSLTALAYNIRRVLNNLGFAELKAALAVCGPLSPRWLTASLRVAPLSGFLWIDAHPFPKGFVACV